MINILIFRTDRIGDLIFTCPTILTLKEYFKNSNITLISSRKNYDYAKRLGIFDEIITYPKGTLNKISFIKNFSKKEFNYTFIYDGKERSVLLSNFIKSKYKVAITQKRRFLFSFFKIKYFFDHEKTDLNTLFQNTLDYCDIKKTIANYDFLLHKNDNKFSEKIHLSNYLHIHLDEKWFSNLYIKKYTNIKPDYNDFINFLNSLSTNNDVLITTGLIDLNLVEDLKIKYFSKLNNKIYFKKKINNSIYLIIKPTFDDLESLLRNAKILISCHGAITHAANSFNIKKIDIIEYKRELFYKRFTSYLKKYRSLYREEFKELSYKILKLLRE